MPQRIRSIVDPAEVPLQAPQVLAVWDYGEVAVKLTSALCLQPRAEESLVASLSTCDFQKILFTH